MNLLLVKINEFCNSRSTVGQIFTLRHAIEKAKSDKAFDFVHPTKTKEILIAYGIPSETVNAIIIIII